MRLFAAVLLTEEQRKAILTYQRALKKSVPPGERVNWSREENLHLTLAFIGEYPEAGPVIRALERVEGGA